MNLSVQNYVINKNTNYTVVQLPKTGFKGKFLTSKAFAAERKMIEKIKTMPNNIFEEWAEFLKFCKNIDIIPKISGVKNKRLTSVHNKNKQETAGSDKALISLIESSSRIIDGYKWLLNNSRKLFKEEIAEIKEIISDPRLPVEIRCKAQELLEKTSG